MVGDGTRLEDAIDRQIAWFRDRLAKALADPKSHVLLDEVTSEFVREVEDYAEGIPVVAGTPARRVTVGPGLVERLPTFPDAPVSQVLEAREELSEGRARYRGVGEGPGRQAQIVGNGHDAHE